ncbi:MAG: MATE family efflux transporter [bacterium]
METIKEKINTYQVYISDLLVLSWPIIIGNLGNMLIGVGDVFVAAKHSTDTLAAISIATAIFMSIFIAGIGLLSSISPVISNLRGQKQKTKNLFAISIIYSIILSIIFFLIVRLSLLFIDQIGLTPALTPMVKQYLDIVSYSIFGAYIFNALKEFLQAYEIVILPNLISIAAIFGNLALCFILVFGLFGFPALGVKGLAIATLIIRSLMGLALFIYCAKFFKGKIKKATKYIKDLFKIGWPISAALFLEFSGFNITAVLVGKISSAMAAAHNIIITFAGVTYMIPMSISNAMAVKVGYANGENNFLDLKRYSIAGVILILVFMSFTAFLFVTIPKNLIEIFTNDIAVIALAIPVMFIVACFQIFDGLQIAFSGIFKGLKVTKPIMLTTALAYWIIGIPIGCVLAFKYHIVLAGFWTGLAIALFVASFVSGGILLIKFKKLEKIHESRG